MLLWHLLRGYGIAARAKQRSRGERVEPQGFPVVLGALGGWPLPCSPARSHSDAYRDRPGCSAAAAGHVASDTPVSRGQPRG